MITLKTPVFIPRYPDCECKLGEKPLTSEQIKQLCQEYQQYGLVDQDHKYFINHKTVGTPLNYELLTENTTITRYNGTKYTYPKGTWIQTLQITDPVTIQGIRTGKLTGTSATTIERDRIPILLKGISTKAHTIQRVFISDLKDPVTVTISIVDKPCVREAVFIEVIDDGENMTELQEEIVKANGFLSRISEAIAVSSKSEQKEETKETKEEVEYVTKQELADVRSEVLEELTTQIGNMKHEILEAIKPKEEASEKEEKEETKEEASEKECEDKKEKIEASSKSLPHHGEANTKSQLSDTATVYKIMGRTSNGSAKR